MSKYKLMMPETDLQVGDRVAFSVDWLRQCTDGKPRKRAEAKRGTVQAKLYSRASGLSLVRVKWDDTVEVVRYHPALLVKA